MTQKVFPGEVVQAQFFPSQHPGHDQITTRLTPPFDAFLIRFPKVHRVESPLPVLTCVDPDDYKESTSPLEMAWDRLGALETWADSPGKVLESWRNRFVFAVEDLDHSHPGLRMPQIGALHAIASHFSVGKEFEPATIVLPTGTGKTETMLADLDDRFHETGTDGTESVLMDSSFEIGRTRIGIMATWRQAVELAMSEAEIEALTALSRSRTEPASRVSRATMLLAYRENPSFFAVGRRLGVHHQTVQRCVERAVAYGALAALDDRPRPGKEPVITPETK
ncbi:DEAD/DEAH box helicase family protein, partial [Bradyrhizobium sp. 142]|uniref:DEAD/DEAH box helicase family protein n=1 Tax=Bradyrhizobium sp. 142 TaxID=2782618 RepID=UPI00320B1F05